MVLDTLTLLFLSVSLAMDAFAVSISSGTVLCRAPRTKALKMAASFGFFQGFMPIIGFLIATSFADAMSAVDHWIAFTLLAFIGGKMLWEVFKGGEDTPKEDPTDWKTLLLLSVATSIDALAVGASMAMMKPVGWLSPWWGFFACAGIIAVITCAISVGGVRIGCKTGEKFGSRAEIAGGIVLIGIGLKILLEDLLG